jgi:hypothetical protein
MATPLSKQHLHLSAQWLYSGGDIHAGFDYKVPIGTPVYAVRAGRILAKHDTIKNLRPEKDGKSGDPPNFVLLGINYKGKPATVVYLHVSPHVPVKVGDEVDAGDLLALSGHNGHSTGPHLHISTLIGHDHVKPFDYLRGLKDNSKPPKRGLASNGLTLYPPSLVYGRERVGRLEKGEVVVADLRVGTRDSDSVRRLQRLLNKMPLDGGRHLEVTGDYRAATRDQVIRWQVQRRHQEPGSPRADGNVHPNQAKLLFKDPAFTLL